MNNTETPELTKSYGDYFVYDPRLDLANLRGRIVRIRETSYEWDGIVRQDMSVIEYEPGKYLAVDDKELREMTNGEIWDWQSGTYYA